MKRNKAVVYASVFGVLLVLVLMALDPRPASVAPPAPKGASDGVYPIMVF